MEITDLLYLIIQLGMLLFIIVITIQGIKAFYRIDNDFYERPLEGHLLGHEIYFDDDQQQWFYKDDNQLVDSQTRRCIHCHQYPTPEGHDPCIAHLPGVQHACCGHGVKPGYVMFVNGIHLQGMFTLHGESLVDQFANHPTNRN